MYALLSAYTKDKSLQAFAAGLVSLKWELLASSGTKKFLDQHGIPSADIGDIVGPPILGHRVVTLDRKIYAGILARTTPEDEAELKRIGMKHVGLVYVGLYPLADELAKPDCDMHSAREMIDIGGPALLRAAAKGWCYTLSSPEQFDLMLRVDQNDDPNPFRRAKFDHQYLAGLAAEAERKVAAYCELVAEFYQSLADGSFPLAKWRKKAA